MDAGTLYTAMGGVLPAYRYAELVLPMNNAMVAAQINNVPRAIMWVAQLGHESVGLKYMEEIASGAAYEGRADLGNVVRGDGVRFKGRGPIQLTGRANYGKFSLWCAQKGYTSDSHYFVDNPKLVGTPLWGFLAASWYWTVARTTLNAASDRGDVREATRLINGGYNGLADRTLRWNRARPLGVRLLPTSQEVPDLDANQANQLKAIADRLGKFDALDRDERWSSEVIRGSLDKLLASQNETNELLRQLVAKP